MRVRRSIRRTTANVAVPARDWTVEVWDDDVSDDDLLALTVTDINGRYYAFDNHFDPTSPPDVPEPAASPADSIDQREFQVLENGAPITVQSGVNENLRDGSVTNYDLTPSVPSAKNPGAIASATANRAWGWVPHGPRTAGISMTPPARS